MSHIPIKSKKNRDFEQDFSSWNFQEMKCLQKKYNKLEEQCKAAVRNYTQMTMSDPTLDFLLMKACEPMIQLFCAVN